MSIEIKVFEKKDISKKYVEWLQDKELTKYTEINQPSLKSIKEYVNLNINDTSVDFWKIVVKNRIHIGNIRVKYLKNSIATIGILIGDKNYKNKGLGDKSLKMALSTLKLKKIKKIYAYINKKNEPSIKIFKKNGFKLSKQSTEKYILNL